MRGNRRGICVGIAAGALAAAMGGVGQEQVAWAGTPTVSVPAPTSSSLGVKPKRAAEYKEALAELRARWSKVAGLMRGVLTGGDAIAEAMRPLIGSQEPNDEANLALVQSRAAMKITYVKQLRPGLLIPESKAIAKIGRRCEGLVQTKDDREFISFEFGKLKGVFEAWMLATISDELTTGLQKLANGDIDGWTSEKKNVEDSLASAERAFAKYYDTLVVFQNQPRS